MSNNSENQKIHHRIVKPVQTGEGKAKPVYYGDVLAEPYAICAFIAKKKSGKTTLEYNMLRDCIKPGMNVYIFASTKDHDPIYGKMVELCEKKKCNVKLFNHFIDQEQGVNYLEAFQQAKDLEAEANEAPKSIETDDIDFPAEARLIKSASAPKEKTKKKKRKSKWQLPETIIIIDDLSSSLRDKTLTYLLTRNRHYKCKIFISMHSVVNLEPKAMEMLDNIVLFGNQSDDRVQETANKLGLHFPEDKRGKSHLINLYHKATDEPYSFLFIDRNNNQYRKNLNQIIYED